MSSLIRWVTDKINYTSNSIRVKPLLNVVNVLFTDVKTNSIDIFDDWSIQANIEHANSNIVIINELVRFFDIRSFHFSGFNMSFTHYLSRLKIDISQLFIGGQINIDKESMNITHDELLSALKNFHSILPIPSGQSLIGYFKHNIYYSKIAIGSLVISSEDMIKNTILYEHSNVIYEYDLGNKLHSIDTSTSVIKYDELILGELLLLSIKVKNSKDFILKIDTLQLEIKDNIPEIIDTVINSLKQIINKIGNSNDISMNCIINKICVNSVNSSMFDIRNFEFSSTNKIMEISSAELSFSIEKEIILQMNQNIRLTFLKENGQIDEKSIPTFPRTFQEIKTWDQKIKDVSFSNASIRIPNLYLFVNSKNFEMIQNIYQHVLSPLISCCTANYLNCIFSIISIKNVEILYNSIGIQMSNTMCTVFTAKKMLFSENNIFISIQPQTLKIPSILTPLDIEEQIKGSFATFINISDDVLIGFHLSNYIISSMNQLMKKNIITPQCQLIIDLENSFYDYFVHDFPFRSIISIQKFELNMSYPDFIGEITSRFVVYVSNNRNSIPASLFNVEKDKFQLYDFAKIGTINLDSFNRSYSDESNREIIHNHIKSISIDGAFCSDSVSLLSAYFSHYYGHKSNESFDKKTFEEEFKRIFNESKQDITLDPQIDLSHSFIKINSALDDLSLMLHKFENEIPGYDINCSEKKINDCERSKVFTGEIGNMEILWSIKSLILTIKLFNGRDFSQKYDFSNICKIPEYINEVVDDDFEWISLRDTSQNLQIESNTSIYIKLYDFNDFIKKSVSCQVNQFSIKDNLLNSSSKYLVTVDQNSHNNFSLEYEHLFNGNSRLYVDLPRFLFYITDQQINYILEFSKNPTISMYCNFPKMYFENVILRFSEIYLNGAFHCYGDFLLDNITVVIPCYQFYGVNGIDELVGDILKSLWADIFKDKASEFVINNTILSNLRVITNTIKPIISLHIKKRGIIRGLIGGLTEMAEIINIESMNGNSRINIIQRIYTLTIKYMDHLQEIDAKSYSHSFSTFIVTKSNTNSKYRISIVPRSFKYRGLNDIKNNIFKNVNKNLIKQ